MTPEGKVKAKVKRILAPYIEKGVVFADWPVPGGYGKSGLDCHLCAAGTYAAIETKAEGKKPTDRQRICIAKIEQAGGAVFVIAGVKDPALDRLKRWLDSLEELHGA